VAQTHRIGVLELGDAAGLGGIVGGEVTQEFATGEAEDDVVVGEVFSIFAIDIEFYCLF
jgi:hypothetical protein